MKKRLLIFVVTIFCLSSVHAYKVGYAIPFNDLPPVHENITNRAFYHMCVTYGLTDLKESPFYKAVFEFDISTCDELEFDFNPAHFSDLVRENPVGGVILGSRFPDLREMSGIDGDMGDYTVVKYSDQVQFDQYRIYPQWHGQISKYYNIFGGDMDLCMKNQREFVRSLLYEMTNLLLARTPESEPDDWFTAYSDLQHELDTGGPDYWYNVPWTNVMLGLISHMLADGFSHDPSRPIDFENNRVGHAAVFYGKFLDENDEMLQVGDEIYWDAINTELKNNVDDMSEMEHHFYYTVTGTLDVNDIPESEIIDDEIMPNYYEGPEGYKWMSATLSTTLSMYCYYEFLELVKFAMENPSEPQLVEAELQSYLDKWFWYDFELVPGFKPYKVQDIAVINPEYAELPWWNYHFTDPWAQSELADITTDGKGAFIMPWTDRNSMGDQLTDENFYPARFVLSPGEEEEYDDQAKIYYIKKDKAYFFQSWYKADSTYVRSLELTRGMFYDKNDEGEYFVSEAEVDIDEDENNNQPGLNRAYAFAYVPPGYRMCFYFPGDPNGEKQSARTDWYDSKKEFYRCFYGSENGEEAHINFHLRRGSYVRILPIDPDGDGIPFLKGYRDDRYSDNCPFDYNPDQRMMPCAEVEDEDALDEEANDEDFSEEPEDDPGETVTEEDVEPTDNQVSDSDEPEKIDKENSGCSMIIF